PRAAAELLAQVPARPPELAARVGEALRAAEARASRLEDLERFHREADVNLGAQLRGRFGAVAGVVWCAIGLASGWLDRSGRWVYGYREALAAAALFAVMCTFFVRSIRRGAAVNGAQRRFLTLVLTSSWGFILHWAMCWALGLPLSAAMALYLLWLAAGWLATALLYDGRVGAGAAAFGVASAVVLRWPRAMFEVFALSTLVAYAVVLLAWNRPTRPPDPPPTSARPGR
ncbi:MAG: hypothetical protein JWM10_4609, partial [Myxococcaceae bacterium]|nr:hypothetical protein [Myxococcaceae bacterium]